VSAFLISCCALGCAAGGLLVPPVAYRLAVPFGQSARDTCAGCLAPLPAGVRGWLLLRQECGNCRTRFGPSRWLTAAWAGLAGGLLGVALGPVAVLPLFLAVAVLGVLLGVIDVACQRLPDQLVLPALAVSPVLLAAAAASTGQWGNWLRGLLAFLGLGLCFTLLALLPGGGFGMGDAKVSALLGWYLGWLGWEAVLLGAILPWLVNAPLLLVLLLSGRASRKTTLPFGPALLTGWLLACAWI
jgi:leader peptidase (prepilin peptidase) / N-methyltransferase